MYNLTLNHEDQNSHHPNLIPDGLTRQSGIYPLVRFREVADEVSLPESEKIRQEIIPISELITAQKVKILKRRRA